MRNRLVSGAERAFPHRFAIQRTATAAFLLLFLFVALPRLAFGQQITQIIDYYADGGEFGLSGPLDLAVDPSGNVFITGRSSDNAFRISPGGVITEIIYSSGDGLGNVLSAPEGVTVDNAGNVYVTGANSDNVFKITPGGAISEILDASGDGAGNPLDYPNSVAVDGSGNVFVTGSFVDKVFKIAPGGAVSVIIGPSGDGAGNILDGPYQVHTDPAGNVYVAGSLSDNVFKITPVGGITEIIDATGDGLGNVFDGPYGLDVDSAGNVYVACSNSNNAFKITPAGVITQIIDSVGDKAGHTLFSPEEVAVDANGNVFVVGQSSNNVFRITPSGSISQIIDELGDGIETSLFSPTGIDVDASGAVYVTGFSTDNAFKIQTLQIDKDRDALIALYNATGGSGWNNNTNWLSAAPVSSWYGITTANDPDAGEYVSVIDLSNNGLSGTMPASWGTLLSQQDALLGMVVLDLGRNQISGSIPSYLGGYVNLTELHLYQNQFSGSIPGALGNLESLSILSLYTNALTGGIPATLSGLSSLTRLSLYQNQLSGSLPDLSGMTQLQSLGLGENSLSGPIPSYLGTFSNLTALDLQQNIFSGAIPASLGNLVNLSLLRLNNNLLTGDVPDSFKLLVELGDLRLNQNNLTGLPDLSGISALSNFPVENNFLSFEDLEKNSTIPGFTYIPQGPLGSPQTISLVEGESAVLSVPGGGSANSYAWFLNGAPIQTGPVATYSISSAEQTDAGTYTVEVTNSIVSDLTLVGEPISVSVTLAPATITVVSPNGGESWAPGDTHPVTWTSENVFGNVGIELWRNGQKLRDVSAAAPNTGSFNWLIPTDLVNGGGYRVVVKDQTDPSNVLDQSDQTFSIAPNVQSEITVTSPSGGEVFGPGETVLIEWTSQNIVGDVSVGLYQNSAFVRTLSSGVPNTGSFQWVIQEDITPGTGYSILVGPVENQGQATSEFGSGIFEIQPRLQPEFVVIRPNGGETFDLGTTEQIQWTSQNVSGNVNLELWLDGVFNRSIVQGTANDGAFDWIIPGDLTPDNAYGVRVVASSNAEVFDDSDASFTIREIIVGSSIDRNALEALYNATGGANWNDNANWLTDAPLDTWYGVDAVNNFGFQQVTLIDLSNNNLAGSLPAEWSNLITQQGAFALLEELSLQSNELVDLVDLSGLSALGTLRVQNNMLTFEDLEPNVSIPTFEYAPQAVFGQPLVLDGVGGQFLTLNAAVGGQNNEYQWFKDGVEIPGATSATFVNQNTTADDSGNYVARVTNTLVTGLTLESAEIQVNLVPAIEDVTEPPEVTPEAGSDVPVAAELSVLFNPTAREICYRRTGDVAYACSALSGSGTMNTGAIPASVVTERGVDYFYRFSVSDVVVTSPPDDPETNPYRLQVPFQQMTAPFTFEPSTYGMISIPYELDSPGVGSVIPGVGFSSTMRLLRWNATANEYDDAPNLPVNFAPGYAFWFISAESVTLTIEDGRTADASEPYPINLVPGWNQIGNPFSFPVSWFGVVNASQVDAPVAFSGSTEGDNPYLYNQTVLQPWEGYWVFNPTSSTVIIRVPALDAGGPGKDGSGPDIADEATYSMQLDGYWPARGLRDSQNYLGLAEGATEGYDAIDFAEAPGIGEHLRLSILQGTTRMAGSFKAADGAGHEWEVEIAAESSTGFSASGEEVTVRLNESGSLPPGLSLYVVDESGERIPEAESSFSVRLSKDRPVRYVRIIVGSSDYAAEQTDGRALVPQRFELEQNYPNPFNPTTRIRYQLKKAGQVRLTIFNALGQPVRTLVDSAQEAGWYDVAWDARDQSGRTVTSGLYFYRMQIGTETRTRTMVLLR